MCVRVESTNAISPCCGERRQSRISRRVSLSVSQVRYFRPWGDNQRNQVRQYPATGAMSSSASNPGIIYALVARGTCVLAEFTTTSGNFTTVTRRILEKLPSDDSKMSYARLRVTAKAATPLCACATARASLSSRGRRS